MLTLDTWEEEHDDVELSWKIRAWDAFMRRAGLKITDAPEPEDVPALRARRRGESFAGRVLAPLGPRLYGRVRPAVQIEDREIELDVEGSSSLVVRLHRPPQLEADAPLIVHFHGGGWVLGDLDGGGPVCSALAEDVGALVVSVDYRLAPEHPAPAAVEDAIAATRWIAAHASDLGAGGPLGVVGDSAGANLATLVAIAARDGAVPPVSAQALIYPTVDLTLSFPSAVSMTDTPGLRRIDMLTFRRHYLGHDEGTDDPALSPWHARDLTGCAAALVQIAEHDPLRDEGRAYAQRLEDAGVPTRLTEYVGMQHGFVSLPGVSGPSATQAVAEVAQFFVDHLRSAA